MSKQAPEPDSYTTLLLSRQMCVALGRVTHYMTVMRDTIMQSI